MKCPNCGADVVQSDRFCTNCGFSLVGGASR
ncbi:zinc-ribbon domain-containing protein [Aeriscardovia aeriphila]